MAPKSKALQAIADKAIADQLVEGDPAVKTTGLLQEAKDAKPVPVAAVTPTKAGVAALVPKPADPIIPAVAAPAAAVVSPPKPSPLLDAIKAPVVSPFKEYLKKANPAADPSKIDALDDEKLKALNPKGWTEFSGAKPAVAEPSPYPTTSSLAPGSNILAPAYTAHSDLAPGSNVLAPAIPASAPKVPIGMGTNPDGTVPPPSPLIAKPAPAPAPVIPQPDVIAPEAGQLEGDVGQGAAVPTAGQVEGDVGAGEAILPTPPEPHSGSSENPGSDAPSISPEDVKIAEKPKSPSDFGKNMKDLAVKYGVPLLDILQAFSYGRSGNTSATRLQTQTSAATAEAARKMEAEYAGKLQESGAKLTATNQAASQKSQQDFLAEQNKAREDFEKGQTSKQQEWQSTQEGKKQDWEDAKALTAQKAEKIMHDESLSMTEKVARIQAETSKAMVDLQNARIAERQKRVGDADITSYFQ